MSKKENNYEVENDNNGNDSSEGGNDIDFSDQQG